MKLNKKFLQVLAALWILIFHVWISITDLTAARFLIRAGYIGVDIFFFVSAWTLADPKREIRYGAFIKKRFSRIFFSFVFFAVIAMLYKGWGFSRFLKIVSFTEFFTRGGGSFLWFLPAIIIFYLLYPLFLKLKFTTGPDRTDRYSPVIASSLVLILWFGLSLLSYRVFGYSKVFIFTNRIPVILAGFLLRRYAPKHPPVLLFGIPVSLVLIYFFGFTRKLNVPFADLYYVLALPFVLGISAVSAYVPDSKALDLLGGATLEVYALQMIFGTDLSGLLYRLIGNKLATNLLCMVILYAASVLIAFVYRKLDVQLSKRLKKLRTAEKNQVG